MEKILTIWGQIIFEVPARSIGKGNKGKGRESNRGDGMYIHRGQEEFFEDKVTSELRPDKMK